MLHFKIIMQL